MLISGLGTTSDDACSRAMDWLLQVREPLEKQVFDRAAEVLGLEVDLLFFDYPANKVRDLALAAQLILLAGALFLFSERICSS